MGSHAGDLEPRHARGEPFSLANFRGRRVMVQFGDFGGIPSGSETTASSGQELLSIFRRAVEQDKVSIVRLIAQDQMESAVEIVQREQLPYILGAVEKKALQNLQANYAGSGNLIVGPGGEIEHVLRPTSLGDLAAKLEAALLE